MKTYLVTGAAGFIGANFVKYMLKKYGDIAIVILDKLTYAGNLGTIKRRVERFASGVCARRYCQCRTGSLIFLPAGKSIMS